MREKPKDRIGAEFGDLTVVEYLGRQKYLCRCACGKEITVTWHQLVTFNRRSCGCWRTREWTPEEDKLLLEMVQAGKPMLEISYAVRHYVTYCKSRYIVLTGNDNGLQTNKMCADCRYYNGTKRQRDKNGAWMARCDKSDRYVHRYDTACDGYRRARRTTG